MHFRTRLKPGLIPFADELPFSVLIFTRGAFYKTMLIRLKYLRNGLVTTEELGQLAHIRNKNTGFEAMYLEWSQISLRLYPFFRMQDSNIFIILVAKIFI